MRILEALKILEAAVIECKTRDIDTPKVREGLDCSLPTAGEWRVPGFREHLKHHEEFGPGGERQQQTLRVYFSGIYSDVRELLIGHIAKLNNRYRKTHDAD